MPRKQAGSECWSTETEMNWLKQQPIEFLRLYVKPLRKNWGFLNSDRCLEYAYTLIIEKSGRIG